jgi:hypothetical protein
VCQRCREKVRWEGAEKEKVESRARRADVMSFRGKGMLEGEYEHTGPAPKDLLAFTMTI